MMRNPSSLKIQAAAFRVGLPFACLVVWAALAFGAGLGQSHADQVDMKNGDRYVGRVLSVGSNSVSLQSEVLGTVTLPRDKVANIVLGNAATAVTAAPVKPTVDRLQAPAHPTANASSELSTAIQQLRNNGAVARQVEDEFLAGASPEARNKYNEMVNGLATGKLTVNDIRNEAKSAADQLRAAKRDLGPEAGDVLDTYLAILDNFLRETPAPPAPA